MNSSPWAKFTIPATPKISASPAAMSAYCEPRITPLTTWSRKNPIAGLLARGMDPLHHFDHSVIEGHDEHVVVRLVVGVEFHRADRRGPVHLGQLALDARRVSAAGRYRLGDHLHAEPGLHRLGLRVTVELLPVRLGEARVRLVAGV